MLALLRHVADAPGGRMHKLEVHQIARAVGLERAALARLYNAEPQLLATDKQDRVITEAGRARLADAGRKGRMTADTTYTPPEQVVAIVTGAGRGIGAAIAERLGADGMAVACLDIDGAAAQETADRLAGQGVTAAAFAARRQRRGRRRPGRRRGGRAARARRRCWSTTPACCATTCCSRCPRDWDTVMQVHLRGTFLMTRAAQKHMTAASYGRVVNLSSTSALGNRGQANYAAAKAGLQGFTKTVAHELGTFGVTCNAVAPGFIVTEMTGRPPSASARPSRSSAPPASPASR